MVAAIREEEEYKEAFISRVKAARARHYKSVPKFAKLLGVPYETYKKYEGRSYLPHYLIERFCALTHVTITHLITGDDS
jgi:DNA-binding transcriptional regulator YiaG